MDIERSLLSKILMTTDLSPVVDARIKPEFFVTDDNRDVFEWVLDFWMAHQKVPEVKTVRREFPDFKLIQVPEPYSFYVEELQDRRRFTILQRAVIDVDSYLEGRDSEGAFEVLAGALQMVATDVSSTRDVNLISNVDDRISEYKDLKNLVGGMRGIPTGFPTIDKATAGLQPQQLVTLVGPPKHGKSTILLSVAKSVQEAGKRSLLVGFEMTNEEQAMRYDALSAGVSFTRLRVGKLTPAEEKKLYRAMQKRIEMPDFWMSADAASTSTVAGVAGKIEQYRPDVAFVDGVYMMQDDLGEPPGTPRALTNITRALKRLAQRVRIPIFITTQVLPSKYTERQGIVVNSIGYTSSFAQDSDVVLGVEKPEEGQAKLSIILSRNSPKAEALLHWDWETSQVEELASEEAEDDSIPGRS